MVDKYVGEGGRRVKAFIDFQHRLQGKDQDESLTSNLLARGIDSRAAHLLAMIYAEEDSDRKVKQYLPFYVRAQKSLHENCWVLEVKGQVLN